MPDERIEICAVCLCSTIFPTVSSRRSPTPRRSARSNTGDRGRRGRGRRRVLRCRRRHAPVLEYKTVTEPSKMHINTADCSAHRHHHIHLVCRDCTNVIEADMSVVAPSSPPSCGATFGFETDMKHFAIFGRCKDCAAKASGGLRHSVSEEFRTYQQS